MEELIKEIKSNQVAAQMFFINDHINFFKKYLEKEKEQICNAYTDGLESPYIGAEQYYNETYNQKKS